MLVPGAENHRNELTVGGLEAADEVGYAVEPTLELLVVRTARDDGVDGTRNIPRIAVGHRVGAVPRKGVDSAALEGGDDVLAHVVKDIAVDVGIQSELEVRELPAADGRMAARQILGIREVGPLTSIPLLVVVQTVECGNLAAEHRAALGQHEEVFVERPRDGRCGGVDHRLGTFGIARRRPVRRLGFIGATDGRRNGHGGACEQEREFQFHVVQGFKIGYTLIFFCE